MKEEVINHLNAGHAEMALASGFDLSFHQFATSWVRAWPTSGDDDLRPKAKGNPKGSTAPENMTKEDQLRLEVEKLRAEHGNFKKLRYVRDQQRS